MSSTINITPSSLIDLNKLSYLTGLNLSTLENLTFISALRKWYGKEASLEGMTSQRILNNTLNNSLVFCPLCLNEAQYFRLIWQVKAIHHCHIHGIPLVDRCSCGKPIPYLPPNITAACCPNCGVELKTLKYEDITPHIEHQPLKDWNFLLDPSQNTLTYSSLYDPKQYLAIKLLFIMSGQTNEFKREKVSSQITQSTIATLLQTARSTASTMRFVHVDVLLTLLRQMEVRLQEFAELEVPTEFCNSILNHKKALKDQFHCLAPWCKSYGIAGSLKRTSTSVKERISGEKYGYYLYCDQCATQYAVDFNTRLLRERGYFIDLGWHKVKPLYEKGLSIRKIAAELGATFDQVLRCIIYLQTNDLLSYPQQDYKDEGLLNGFYSMIKSHHPIKQIKKELKLSHSEFMKYWLYHKLQLAYLTTPKPRQKQSSDLSWQNKCENYINSLITDTTLITIKRISQELGTCPETLRLHGLLPVIKQAKNRQNQIQWDKRSHELKSRIDSIISTLTQMEGKLSSEAIYRELGVRRTVLVRSHPELTHYINQYYKSLT
jgi:hypothetical protein